MEPTTDYNEDLDAGDFLGGNYLRKEDLPPEGVVANIVDVRAEELSGSKRRKLVAYFDAFPRGLVLNATNTRQLATKFGSRVAHWRGPIRLFVDETVAYAGRRIGGIRLAEPAANDGFARAA